MHYREINSEDVGRIVRVVQRGDCCDYGPQFVDERDAFLLCYRLPQRLQARPVEHVP